MRSAARTRVKSYRPLAAEAWQACFWAEDPDQAAPSNGASVTSWHNAGTNGDAWTEATNPPTYRSNVARFGGKPGLEFDGTNDTLRVSGSWSNISAPYTVMMVVEPLSETELILGGHGGSDTGALFSATNGLWQGQTNILGTANSSGLATVGAHIIVFTVNGASSSLYVNGVQQSFTADIGTVAQTTPVLARHGSILWGNVRFGFAGWLQGTVSESKRKRFERWASNHYQLPLGFEDDFVRDDSDTIGKAWTDFNETNPTREDKSGIIDNGYGILEFQGAVDQQADSTGWRGGAYRAMPNMTNGVRIVTTVSDVSPFSGSGAIHVNPRVTSYAAGTWYHLGFGIPVCEVGSIGLNQPEFSYYDFNLLPNLSAPYVSEIRAVDGMMESYCDGVRWGVAPIPDELLNSPFHGMQIDMGSNVVGKSIDNITIEPWYGTITDYSPAAIEATGAVAKSSSSNSIDVAVPSGVVAGEILIAIIGVNGGGTLNAPDGTWSKLGQGGNSFASQISYLKKTATGSETGTVTFTKTGGTTSSITGVMMRFSNTSPETSQAVTGTIQGNASSSSVTASSVGVLGRHRRSLWAAFSGSSTTITLPGTFSPVAATAGGSAGQLVVGTRTWEGTIDPPFGSLPIQTGTQVGSASPAAQSATLHMLILPDPNI